MSRDCRATSLPTRLLGLALLAGACCQSQAAGSAELKHAVTLYGWLPGVSGETKYPGDGGATVDSSAILDALEMAFMGTYELRAGPWSLLADAVYLDLGNDKQSRVGLPGGGEISADVDQQLSGWQIGLYGGYQVYRSDRLDMSLLAGLRYLTIDSSAALRIDAPPPPTFGTVSWACAAASPSMRSGSLRTTSIWGPGNRNSPGRPWPVSAIGPAGARPSSYTGTSNGTRATTDCCRHWVSAVPPWRSASLSNITTED